MDPDLEIPSLKPLQPLYVDSWASLHVNIKNLNEKPSVGVSIQYPNVYKPRVHNNNNTVLHHAEDYFR